MADIVQLQNRTTGTEEFPITLTEAVVDSAGSKLSTFFASGTLSATKLKTARTIALSGGATGTATSFDGSKNISIPVTSVNTSKLAEPDTLTAATTPTTMPMINTVRANHLAFLPAVQCIIEQTTDGGTTWTDAGISDSSKATLFSGNNGGINIPLKDGVRSTDCALRITITGMKYNVPDGTAETAKYAYWNSSYVKSCERYFALSMLYIWCSSIYDKIRATVQRAKGSDPNNWVTVRDSATSVISGWSGGNFLCNLGNATFGGSTSQTTNYWNWRIILRTCAPDGTFDDTKLNTTAAYISSKQCIYRIQGYGNNIYTSPNSMASIDHLYTWDNDKNATFPAKLIATAFRLSGGTSNCFLKADGSTDSNAYALSSHSHAIAGVTGLQNALDCKETKISSLPSVTTLYTSDAIPIDSSGTSKRIAVQYVLQVLGATFAAKASPALTGTPTAPTAAAGTNTTQLATTAFVQAAVAAFLPLAGGTLTGRLAIESNTLGAVAHILFNRTNFNYIQIPTGGTFAVSVAAASGAASRLAVDSAAVYPGYTNQTVNLGTSSYQWGIIYGKTLYQNGTKVSVEGHTHSQYLTAHQTLYALTFQAGTFAAATYTPNAAAKTINIPTKTSHLTNDSGFLTSHQSLASYAPLASPTFTGTPKAPTAASGTNTTQLATTAFVQTAVSGLSNFNNLTNRPKYNGSTMSGSTSIPEVKTAVWDAKVSSLLAADPPTGVKPLAAFSGAANTVAAAAACGNYGNPVFIDADGVPTAVTSIELGDTCLDEDGLFVDAATVDGDADIHGDTTVDGTLTCGKLAVTIPVLTVDPTTLTSGSYYTTSQLAAIGLTSAVLTDILNHVCTRVQHPVTIGGNTVTIVSDVKGVWTNGGTVSFFFDICWAYSHYTPYSHTIVSLYRATSTASWEINKTTP